MYGLGEKLRSDDSGRIMSAQDSVGERGEGSPPPPPPPVVAGGAGLEVTVTAEAAMVVCVVCGCGCVCDGGGGSGCAPAAAMLGCIGTLLFGWREEVAGWAVAVTGRGWRWRRTCGGSNELNE